MFRLGGHRRRLLEASVLRPLTEPRLLMTLEERFDQPASFYVAAYHSSRSTLGCNAQSSLLCAAAAHSRLFEHRARAKWALVNRGAESVTFLLDMLAGDDPAVRDDARSVLRQLASNDEVVRVLMDLLDSEPAPDRLVAAIDALGTMRDPRAVSPLVRMVHDPNADGSVVSVALESLGRIALRRFDRSEDPLGALDGWLATQGHAPVATAARAIHPPIQTTDHVVAAVIVPAG